MPSVLIVDDDTSFLDLVETLLTKVGYEVETAETGLDGIEKAHSSAPDLILLDVLMPDVDGFQTLTFLQAEPATAKIPVVMLSSQDTLEDVTRGMQLGAIDYIGKPCEPMALLAAVRSLVPTG